MDKIGYSLKTNLGITPSGWNWPIPLFMVAIRIF
jgi:hypothetical protein